MKIISFELTMPVIGSWNGKWLGSEKKFYIIRKIKKKKITPLFDEKTHRDFSYDFGDGWRANVRMEITDKEEAKIRTKNSSGFCGYEWMIDSIIKNGEIIFEE